MTVPGWNFEQPTEAGLLDDITVALGDRKGAGLLLDLGCLRLGLKRPIQDTGDIIAVAEWLLEFGDLMRVTGRSAKIRAVTYRALNASVVTP